MQQQITFHNKNSPIVKELQNHIKNTHAAKLDQYHVYSKEDYYKLYFSKYKYLVMTNIELIIMNKKDSNKISQKQQLIRNLYYENESLSDKYISSKLSFIIRYKPTGVTINNNVFNSLASYFIENDYPYFCVEEILYIKTLSQNEKESMIFHTESAAPKGQTKNVLKNMNKQCHSIIIDISYEFSKEITKRLPFYKTI